MSGRSGRPKFSKEGKSIVFANSETQKDLYMEDYINGSPEPVNSQLGIVPILRTHILGLVAIRYVYDLKSAETFFSKTFYAKQFGEMPELLEKIMEIINNLEEFGFVKKSGSMNPMLARYEPTKLGKRVSDLFLDPESAYSLIQALRVKKTFTPFSYLFAWANCMEFSPWLNTPKKIEPIIPEEINSRFFEVPFSQEKLLFEPESTNKFFSAMMLEQWVEEKREQELFEKYGVLPGTLFGKTRIVEWLAYSTIELSKVLGLEHHLIPAKRLSDRAKYGVKEELLSLVQLKGVGRVRARRLFNAGITKPSEIKKNLSKVEGMFGKAVSLQLAKQLSA
jgi:helicase